MRPMRAGPERPADPLSTLVWRGGELLGLAAMIGDQDDLHVWRRKRNAWVEHTARAIEQRDADAVEAFWDAARVKRPLAGWQIAIPGELEALRAAILLARRVERASRPAAGQQLSPAARHTVAR